MSDPERIWLQNADDARATGDRLWCQDKVWPECAEQQEPTEYIRADLYASRISQQDAELERVRREVEEVREALKPFAERAARFDDIPGIYRCNDNVELWQDGNWRCDLTVGDLRKARAAIAGISEPEETRT